MMTDEEIKEHQSHIPKSIILENEELHSIIKHILGISDNHKYIADAYKQAWNKMLEKKKEEINEGN